MQSRLCHALARVVPSQASRSLHTMRAVSVSEWQETAQLKVSDVEAPTLASGGSDAVLCEVAAAGCNFFDNLMAAGKYQVKPAFPFILGSEFSGTVLETNSKSRFRPGDKVYGTSMMGAFAERVVVPEEMLYKMPATMTMEEAAAFPMVYGTSYAGLVYRGQLKAGETLLVHAAAGGCGSSAVQIGKALGARVIATCGSDEKCQVAIRAGADHAINYTIVGKWHEEVLRLTEGKGADVIYDPVGGQIFDDSLRCIAWNGRIVVVGFTSGTIPKVALNRVLLKNIAVVGLHWGEYQRFETPRVPETHAALHKLYTEGKIRPMVFKAFPIERVADALTQLGSRGTWGKVVLSTGLGGGSSKARL